MDFQDYCYHKYENDEQTQDDDDGERKQQVGVDVERELAVHHYIVPGNNATVDKVLTNY